jgi:hypothetical protein
MCHPHLGGRMQNRYEYKHHNTVKFLGYFASSPAFFRGKGKIAW